MNDEVSTEQAQAQLTPIAERLENLVRTSARARSTGVPMRFDTMDQQLAEHATAPRFRTILVSGLGLIALCLALAGVYGVMSYRVGHRTREIGLRMSLGATKVMILRMVVREGAVLGGAGLLLGVVGAVASTRMLRSVLFQIQPYDLLTYSAGMVFLTVVVAAACYIPANIDPLEALRLD